MGEPSLSDREQAILASLAARAEADDPRLARLMKRGRRALLAGLPALPASVEHWMFGVVLALVGLFGALALLGVSPVAALLVSLLLFAGVGRVAVSGPWHHREPGSEPGDQAGPPA